MAKATAKCTCAECGATFEKTKKCYNRREADNWESWAIHNFTQCPQCWGKEQRKREQETPLTLNVAIDPFSVKNPIVLYFSGNTMPSKDKIKELGYVWIEMPISGFFGMFNTKKPQKCWNKMISLELLENELKQAEEIGATIVNKVTNLDIVAYNQVKTETDKKEAEKQEKLAQLEKPKCPDILVGKKWNGKIYGKSGTYCFYGNNERIDITNSQKEEIDNYLKEKETYRKAVTEIENNYR